MVRGRHGRRGGRFELTGMGLRWQFATLVGWRGREETGEPQPAKEDGERERDLWGGGRRRGRQGTAEQYCHPLRRIRATHTARFPSICCTLERGPAVGGKGDPFSCCFWKLSCSVPSLGKRQAAQAAQALGEWRGERDRDRASKRPLERLNDRLSTNRTYIEWTTASPLLSFDRDLKVWFLWFMYETGGRRGMGV